MSQLKALANAIGRYILQVLIGIDQLFNTLFAGWADETLSSRAYRRQDAWYWHALMRVIDTIFFWQDRHCERSYFSEINRRQFPPRLRDN